MLKRLLSERGSIIELCIAAIMLAFGVHFLAVSAIELIDLSPWYVLWIGVAICTFVVGGISRKLLKQMSVDTNVVGFFVYDKKANRLVVVPRYKFSERLSANIDSLFAENSAVEKQWNAEPLKDRFKIDATAATISRKSIASILIVEEAVECFLLDRLCTHLSDYFNKSRLDEQKTRTLIRESIPEVLFKNRFIDTFSRPMKDRPLWVDSAINEKLGASNIISAYGPNKAQYRKFELVLPQNSKVTRSSPKNSCGPSPIV